MVFQPCPFRREEKFAVGAKRKNTGVNPRKTRGLSLVPMLCGYKYLHEILSQKTGKEFLRY
jgi:hypothetical protein